MSHYRKLVTEHGVFEGKLFGDEPGRRRLSNNKYTTLAKIRDGAVLGWPPPRVARPRRDQWLRAARQTGLLPSAGDEAG